MLNAEAKSYANTEAWKGSEVSIIRKSWKFKEMSVPILRILPIDYEVPSSDHARFHKLLKYAYCVQINCTMGWLLLYLSSIKMNSKCQSRAGRPEKVHGSKGKADKQNC